MQQVKISPIKPNTYRGFQITLICADRWGAEFIRPGSGLAYRMAAVFETPDLARAAAEQAIDNLPDAVKAVSPTKLRYEAVISQQLRAREEAINRFMDRKYGH